MELLRILYGRKNGVRGGIVDLSKNYSIVIVSVGLRSQEDQKERGKYMCYCNLKQ